MEGHLEALLEMDFCTKPPNFGVEAHMEAPTGDALRKANKALSQKKKANKGDGDRMDILIELCCLGAARRVSGLTTVPHYDVVLSR
jgi:hypothetical protein